MKKQTYIHIEEPCHENWSNMTFEAQGRFCQSCSKTVTDFSSMSDTEILKFLSTTSGSTCGRFTSDQLDRQIHVPATPAKKTFWAYILSMFLPVMIADRLNAQKKVSSKLSTEQNVKSKMSKPFIELPVSDLNESDSTKFCDSTKAITATGDPFETYKMGMVISYEPVTVKDTVTTIVKKVTKNDLFKIYPNPAVKGKKVSIRVNKAGEYTLQLLDMESKMIIYKTITVSSKGQIVFLDLPSNITSGSYYIRLVQAGSNTQYVDKLIVK
jgi:hypothetical protein